MQVVRGGEVSGNAGDGQASEGFFDREALSGNWGGARDLLGHKGLEFSLEYRADNLANVAGGVHRGTAYIHNLDATIFFDADKAFGWTGTSLFVHLLSNNGGHISPSVGDCQIVSNIEAYPTTKLYQLWLDQTFADDVFSFRLGLYDLNSEFYVTSTSGIFLNSSQGIGKDISQSGANGPSIFPNTALAARVSVSLSPSFRLQTVVIDGVPGSEDDPDEPSFEIDADDGALFVGELAWLEPGSGDNITRGKVALGGWMYTAPSAVIVASGPDSAAGARRNHGLYALAEHQLFSLGGEPSRGMSAFLRVGLADGMVNEFGTSVGAGVVVTGLWEGRRQDQIGICISSVSKSAYYRDALSLTGQDGPVAESSIEFTYRASFGPWLAVQPDIQWVINPSTELGRRNALVVGARLDVRI